MLLSDKITHAGVGCLEVYHLPTTDLSGRVAPPTSFYVSPSLSRSPCVWHCHGPHFSHGDRFVARVTVTFIIPFFALTRPTTSSWPRPLGPAISGLPMDPIHYWHRL